MTYFLDSSALGKIYHFEPGTRWMRELFEGADVIFVSELSVVEFHSMSARRVREGVLSPAAMDAMSALLEADLTKRFESLPISTSVVARAISILNTSGRSRALRSLDAIQVACLSELMDAGVTFLSGDKRLLVVAQDLGFRTANPSSLE